MRLKLIACEVLFRELCDAVARSRHRVDVEFLTKGLHERGACQMKDQLQRAIDAVPAGAYDAILLGYGLCGDGVVGVAARDTMLVLPRAHDCISLLLGSRRRYQAYFEEHPGTCYRSCGWMERGHGMRQLSPGRQTLDVTLESLIEKHGEAEGRRLFTEATHYRSHYHRSTFIETGLEPDLRFEDEARWEAAERGWTFDKLQGDLTTLRRLVNGEWREADFLLVHPGERCAAARDQGMVRVEEIQRR